MKRNFNIVEYGEKNRFGKIPDKHGFKDGSYAKVLGFDSWHENHHTDTIEPNLHNSQDDVALNSSKMEVDAKCDFCWTSTTKLIEQMLD